MKTDWWMVDEIVIYDLSDENDPLFVYGCMVREIHFGENGSIELVAFMPRGAKLYDIPESNVRLQIMRVECGRADIYENCTPIVELTDGTASKWMGGLNEHGEAIQLRAIVEGKVVLLKEERLSSLARQEEKCALCGTSYHTTDLATAKCPTCGWTREPIHDVKSTGEQ